VARKESWRESLSASTKLLGSPGFLRKAAAKIPRSGSLFTTGQSEAKASLTPAYTSPIICLGNKTKTTEENLLIHTQSSVPTIK
jgi:hypothetical protein